MMSNCAARMIYVARRLKDSMQARVKQLEDGGEVNRLQEDFVASAV